MFQTDLSPAHYDRKTVTYHWLSAVLIFGMWLVGQSFDYLPDGQPSDVAMSLHVLTGLLLAVVILLRLQWRFTGGIRLPLAQDGLLGKVSKGVHHLLYLLTLLTVVLGVLAAWAHGVAVIDWFQWPELRPGDREFQELTGDLHGLLANLLVALAAAHGAMAAWHRWVLKDTIAQRMDL